jgi:hypothetical protein
MGAAQSRIPSLFQPAWTRQDVIRSLDEANIDYNSGQVALMVPSQLTLAMKAQVTSVPPEPDSPPLFKLAMVQTGVDEAKKLWSFDIGVLPISQGRREVHILVVGVTGTGKTTWINGLGNYLSGVKWPFPFRFKVITEEDETGLTPSSDAFSHTDYVTSYRFWWRPGFPCDFSVVLIDTPGFADTRGIQRDNEIVVQLETLLKTPGILGVDQFDAIALVVQ